jgi:hypothetical protein
MTERWGFDDTAEGLWRRWLVFRLNEGKKKRLTGSADISFHFAPRKIARCLVDQLFKRLGGSFSGGADPTRCLLSSVLCLSGLWWQLISFMRYLTAVHFHIHNDISQTFQNHSSEDKFYKQVSNNTDSNCIILATFDKLVKNPSLFSLLSIPF